MAPLLTAIEVETIAQTVTYIVGRLAARALADLVPTRAGRASRSELKSVHEYVTLTLTELDLSEYAASEDALAALRRYFHSPEFVTFLDHVLTASLAADPSALDALHSGEFARGAELHGFTFVEDVAVLNALATFIVSLCRSSVVKSSLPPPERVQPYVDSIYVSAIERHLECLAGTTVERMRAADDFVRLYRSAVAEDMKSIVPPNFDESRPIPIDQLFVPPSITRSAQPTAGTSEERLTVATFEQRLDRTVLIGDPGGGKSTLTRKIANDLAKGARQVSPSCDVELLPFVVTLRDYANYRASDRGSISDYLGVLARATYQVAAPEGTIDWLLESGRAAVLFDGLDELLDTSLRQDITRAVESFATRFPHVPMLVTSRRVGYAQAPLDPTRFQTHELAPFTNEQVAQYARNWFDLDYTLVASTREKLAAAFLAESAVVSDIRSNPLLLALMCTIYRGEAYIPRNRPEVYEKCALMLFDRWDRGRGIRAPLPFEAHLDPAMKDLAYWIFSEERLQGGVTESQLLERSLNFLERELYTGAKEEALVAAKEFIAFCRGRAWVFTDTGTTPSGEKLYQFTHRTFLEYFAAAHLARISKSVSALTRVLLPRVRRAEWDVVAQLAIQIFAKAQAGAATELLDRILRTSRDERATHDSQWNLVSFAARCLAFLVVPRTAAETVARRALEVHDTIARVDPRSAAGRPGVEILDPLLNVAHDNRPAIAQAIEAHYVESSADDAAVLRLLGPLSLAVESADWAYDELLAPDRPLGQEMDRRARREPWAALWAWWHGRLSGVDFIEAFGLAGLLLTPAVPEVDTQYIALGQLVVREVVSPSDKTASRDISGLLDTVATTLSVTGFQVVATRRPGFLFPRTGSSSETATPLYSDRELAASVWLLAAAYDIFRSEETAVGRTEDQEEWARALTENLGVLDFAVPAFRRVVHGSDDRLEVEASFTDTLPTQDVVATELLASLDRWRDGEHQLVVVQDGD